MKNQKEEEIQKKIAKLIDNGAQFHFYEVQNKIEVKNHIEDNKILATIEKGEIVIRIAEGIVSSNVPLDLMYLTDFSSLYKQGLLKEITEEKEKIGILYLFVQNGIIDNLQILATRDFLVNFELLEDFINIPEQLKENLRVRFDKLLK